MAEIAGDLVPFNENEKEVRKECDKRMTAIRIGTIRVGGSSPEYEHNYERIFGHK